MNQLMDLKFRTLILLSLVVGFAACKKADSSVTFVTLTGKWKLAESLAINSNGNYAWQTPGANDSKEIEFVSGGYYREHIVKAGVLQICAGRYQISGVNTLGFSTDCKPNSNTATLAVLAENELRLDFTGTNGTLKERFVSVK
jgi:hypothetical protein